MESVSDPQRDATEERRVDIQSTSRISSRRRVGTSDKNGEKHCESYFERTDP